MNSHALALVAAVIGGSVGQLFMKLAMLEIACLNTGCFTQLLLQQHAGIGYLIAGIALYLISVFLWIFALRKYPLNYAYPMLACGYAIVYLGAALPPLSEALTTHKTLGVLLVITGVTLCAQHSFCVKSEE